MNSTKDKTGDSDQKNPQDQPDCRALDPIYFNKQLSQYNELIMIGRLTPEVVHDINNYLTGILGYTELLSMKKIEDETIKNGLKNIYLSAEKCKDLLSILMALTGQEPSTTRLGSLNEVIEKTIILRSCALRHKQIRVIKELGDTIPAVPLQGNKLEKVLLSLIFYIEETFEEKEKERRLVFKTVLQSPEEAIIIITFNGSEKLLAVLSNFLKFDPGAEKKDLRHGFDLKEVKQWLCELGASLELQKEGEEGLTLLIHLPLTK
jgi:two-component system, NtrC family, sensor kinase